LVLRRPLQFAKDFSEIFISYFVTVKAVFVQPLFPTVRRPAFLLKKLTGPLARAIFPVMSVK
jgi:hypothetical protein